MTITPLRIEQNQMIADVYARAYAAVLGANDPGILPEAEAKKAVVGFIRVMKSMELGLWIHWNEEAI